MPIVRSQPYNSPTPDQHLKVVVYVTNSCTCWDSQNHHKRMMQHYSYQITIDQNLTRVH